MKTKKFIILVVTAILFALSISSCVITRSHACFDRSKCAAWMQY